METADDAYAGLLDGAQDGDVVLVQGAGNVNRVSQLLTALDP